MYSTDEQISCAIPLPKSLSCSFPMLSKLNLFFYSVIQDKFCGIINISVEGLHDVMTEDSETGTYKE